MNPIRVIVIDDSPLMRAFLAESIGQSEGFRVVATAHDGADAWEKIQIERPDVVTLDVEMPGTDGISLLKRIMTTCPLPVVMVSSQTQTGARITLEALRLGAVDVVGKPTQGVEGVRAAWMSEVVMKLRRAATIRPVSRSPAGRSDRSSVVLPTITTLGAPTCQYKLIVAGGGSGATEAVSRFLSELPRDCPPVVLALQLAPLLLDAWAASAGRSCSARLHVGTNGELLQLGVVYVSPGDRHVSVSTNENARHLKLTEGAPIHCYRPSIDALFESVFRCAPNEVAAVLFDSASDDGRTSLRVLASRRIRAVRQTHVVGHTATRNNQNTLCTNSHSTTEPVVLPIEQVVQFLFGANATIASASQS